jgi:acylphosphatase
LIRKRVVVSGRVQGVWYRDSCRNQAEILGVRGWVANRSDGAVVAEVEGDERGIDALIAWMHTGPPRAVVTKVEVTEVAGGGDWVGFRVLSTPPP